MAEPDYKQLSGELYELLKEVGEAIKKFEVSPVLNYKVGRIDNILKKYENETTNQMITTEQILELAKEHLDVSTVDKEKLVKFALKVADIEYDRGFDDGWESRADAEKELKRSKEVSNEEIFCLVPG